MLYIPAVLECVSCKDKVNIKLQMFHDFTFQVVGKDADKGWRIEPSTDLFYCPKAECQKVLNDIHRSNAQQAVKLSSG